MNQDAGFALEIPNDYRVTTWLLKDSKKSDNSVIQKKRIVSYKNIGKLNKFNFIFPRKIRGVHYKEVNLA